MLFFRKRWTMARLAVALQDLWERVLVMKTADDRIALKGPEGIAALIQLSSDRRSVQIIYSMDLRPHAAGALALAINSIVPTTVDTEQMFTAEAIGGGTLQ
jgi:hypothetical protein